MKKNNIVMLTLLSSAVQLSAITTQDTKDESLPKITILNDKSEEFLLGKETDINMKFVPQDAPDMWFKAGVRLQGTLESKSTDYKDVTKLDTDINDIYLRRVRFEVAAGFGKYASFTMDIRNDKSNYGIENDEGSFNVGDAYVKIKKPFSTSLLNFKLYRAKIDVSRTETVKSARVISYDRPYVADAAAQYISFNRRGANIQAYGDWNKKIYYQVAVGSASSPKKVLDALGSKTTQADMQSQSFFYGGKLILSPFDGWEEISRTETYFAKGKHFSVGASYWNVPEIKGTIDNGVDSAEFDLNRELINMEISAHYYGAFIQGEYFKFKDAVKAWDLSKNGGVIQTGDSSGWYVVSEYVFDDFYYIAPFMRYESWDRFEEEEGYDLKSTQVGFNWYLRGNTIKVGLYYQKDEYGVNTGDKDVDIIRFTSQWFF